MKTLMGLIFYSVMTLANDSSPAPQIDGAVLVSGTPRIMRASSLGTEVIFTDLKQSYFIPLDGSHNFKFELINAAISKKQSVGFQAEAKSRRILYVNGQKVPVKIEEAEEDQAEAPTKGSAGAKDVKPGSSSGPHR